MQFVIISIRVTAIRQTFINCFDSINLSYYLTEPIPKDKSPHKLYAYMDKNASNSEAQKQLFEILLTETNNKNYCKFNKQLLTEIVFYLFRL